jgi:hypothetical protein
MRELTTYPRHCDTGTVKELWLARMERAKCLLHLRRYEDSLNELNEVSFTTGGATRSRA